MDGLIFDFDGLIIDTEWPAFVTVAEEFEAHGSSITLDEWRERIGRADNRPWTELLEARVGSIDVVTVDERRRTRKNVMTDSQPVLPGVFELLEAAESMGLPVAVASSSPRSWVERHLDRKDLLERFVAVRTRDDVDRGKPWPDLFETAAAAMGVPAERAIALEDSVHGVTAAKAAGTWCVAVPNRVTEAGDFSSADLVVDSLAEFDLGRRVSSDLRRGD